MIMLVTTSDSPVQIAFLPRQRFRPWRLLALPSVHVALGVWIAANSALLLLSHGHLPFQSETLSRPATGDRLLTTNLMFVEVFVQMGIVHLLTRHRDVPDIADRSPDRRRAGREVAFMLAYGIAAMLGGYGIGHAFGWHPLGFHLDGMVIRTPRPVTPAESIGWGTYNGAVYALIPYVIFRRRYSARQLNVKSTNRGADLLTICVVLVIESAVQLTVEKSSILALSPHQALISAPLTFVISFAGTVLPTMVFIYCILVPRYMKLTGSIPATVILGGATYALLHFFDGWTTFASPAGALMSVLYLLLFYSGPGMFKTFITIRTANAWTHVWAYHAIAPHTLVDAPMFAKIFSIR